MRVALITSGFFPNVDGVTVTLFHRLQLLSQRGHHIKVFAPDYSAVAHLYPQWQTYVGQIMPGIEIVGLASEAFMGLEFERNPTRASLGQLQHHLEDFQPELIQVEEPERLFLSLFTAPGVQYAKQHNIPCLAFFHTNFVDYIEDFVALPWPWLQRLSVRCLQTLSQQIIARVFNAYDVTLCSNAIALERLHTLGIKNAQAHPLLGVHLESFHPELITEDFFATHYNQASLDQQIKLIFLGRLTPDKGWSFTLQALQQWVQQIPAESLDYVSVIIAGDGDLKETLISSLAALPLDIHFLGRIPPENVPALLEHCDIHVTTSEKETLGMTVLEAFAAATPVLAPNAGGVTHLIHHERNGLLFEPGNPADFIHKLMQLIENTALRRQLGRAGRQDAMAYGWSRAIDQLEQVWQQQTAQKSDTPSLLPDSLPFP